MMLKAVTISLAVGLRILDLEHNHPSGQKQTMAVAGGWGQLCKR